MSHDIGDKFIGAQRLVVASWIKGQFAQQIPIVADDSYIGAGDHDANGPMVERVADSDVAKPTEVAQGDAAETVDLVSTNPEMRDCRFGGFGLDSSVECDERSQCAQRAMGSLLVVVAAEGIELNLQMSQ